mgnify:CR=1 FL=1|jgi:hypothetical protein
MSGDFRFDFSKKFKGKRVQPVPENLDENAREYRERARAERKRFVDATDTEFWLCLCFPSTAEMTRWRERFGFGEEHRIYVYRDVEELLASFRPSRSSAVAFGAGVGFAGGLGFAEKTPDPLAGVEYTDDLERDCLAEFAALHKALVSARSPEKIVEPTDSEHWFAIAFPLRDDKDSFLAEYGLRKLGDKYLDGRAVMKKLGG